MPPRDDLLHEFLVESHENLDRLDGEFLALEEDPGSEATLSSIFRTIHTIKGTCGFFELPRLESVTHAGENLLSALRAGDVAVDDRVTGELLRLVDVVRDMLAHLEATGEEKDEDHGALVASLERLRSPGGDEGSDDDEPVKLGELLEATGAATHEAIERSIARKGEGDARPIGEILVQDHGVSAEAIGKALSLQADLAADFAASRVRSSISASSIRVQVEQLDRLMELTGELVLVRNQILQLAARSDDEATVAASRRLNEVTTALQERIVKVRMQPVGILWSKLPRFVRDLSRQLGKSVRIEMRGKEIELDKTLLEAIKDPLVHLVRNAVDHGLERPAEREAAGKPAEGTLLLNAYHESGQVHIDVVDDGKGIDPEVIRAKAVSMGLLSDADSSAPSDRQVLSMVFLPGLTTVARVTNVSGRGVGMDVVKSNVERIGGTVEVRSNVGRGTTVRIKTPLTLAIVPALVVTSGGRHYAVPRVGVVEVVRFDSEDAAKNLEVLDGRPAYRRRGERLPLLFLDEQLGLAAGRADAEDRWANLVVARASDQLVGLVVDSLGPTEEIVVKPLDGPTEPVPTFVGSTILGDGHVAPILDVLGLARRAGVIANGDDTCKLDPR